MLIPAVLLISQWGRMDASDDNEAMLFVSGVIESAAPDALVFSRGDGKTFGMWYTCYVLDERPDLVPILHTFLRSAWYRDALAANHEGLDLRPAGLGSDALQTMIKRHLGQRPIFLTWEDEEIKELYRLVQIGPLWEVKPPAGGEVP